MEETTSGYHVANNGDVEHSVLSAAQSNYRKGNYKEALKLFLDATSMSVNPDLFVDIGNCYYMLDNQHDALVYWNKAIEIDSKNSKAYANLGNLHYKNKDVEKAISLWLVALISKPEDANTCLNLAIAFNEKSMRFESIKYFEKYLKYEEDKNSSKYYKIRDNIIHCLDTANKYLSLGVQLQNEGDNKKAAACYFKSLATYPNLVATNQNLGSVFYQDKNYELAIKYWKIVTHLNRDKSKIYSNIAVAYDMLESFDYAYCYYFRYLNYIASGTEEASKVNQRFFKIKLLLNKSSNIADVHLELAKEYLANNQFEDAIDEFHNYAILKPEEEDNYKDLIKKLESYLNPEREIIANCFDIGDILISNGDYSSAKQYFARILRLSSPELLEYTKARAKYSKCEKSIVES